MKYTFTKGNRMKISVPPKKNTARIVPATVAFLLLFVAMSTYATDSRVRPLSSRTGIDSIFVEKQFSSRKYKIKLYPNANQQVLFFTASGEEGKIYQLFLFDMDGGLVKQANIKNKQTTVINNLDNGVYLFQVFSDDEPIANGKVTVK